MYVCSVLSVHSILSSIVSSVKETFGDFRIKKNKKKKKKKHSEDECIAETDKDKDIEVVQAQPSVDVASLWELAKSLVKFKKILVTHTFMHYVM